MQTSAQVLDLDDDSQYGIQMFESSFIVVEVAPTVAAVAIARSLKI